MSVIVGVAAWALLAVPVAIVIGGLIRRGDQQLAEPEPSPQPSWDEHWLDVWPAETLELSDAEVERRFARIAGWVQ